MKKTFLYTVLALSIQAATAQEVASLPTAQPTADSAPQPVNQQPAAAALPNQNEYEKLYFPGKNPELTYQEKQAIAIAKRWKDTSATGMKPVQGPDGSISFLYGASQPSIVCAVMQVCDIQLQPGEKVQGLHLGDTARWTAAPAITGTGANEIIHVIIKPHDVGLDTTLIVTTDRRTYNFRLRSHRTEFMPRVSFTYPDDALAKWEQITKRETVERETKTIPQTGEYLGDLNFNYVIDGKAAWKPVRVYNDGKKTIIQMPTTINQSEAPALLVVRESKAAFTDDEEILVNYRVQGDRYIVDSVFDKAVLIAGVGRAQARITITRGQ